MLKELYLKNSLIPIRYQQDITLRPSKNDIETFKYFKYVSSNIKSFVDKGENILICSNNSGNGKTTVATKLIKAYIDSLSNSYFENNTPALFVNVSNFLNEKKLAISDKKLADKLNQIEKSILSAKLVVFDDIADKSLSEYDMNTLYYWVEYRTSNLKSCIYTSNQLPDQLINTLSGKVYSRIVNYSTIKEITSGDHRGV